MKVLQVVVHEKGGRTQRFSLAGDQFTVGREDDNDLVLDRANVSKHHLCLRRRDGAIEVVDLESTNGTYLNGRRVGEPRPVRRADRIYVGDFILMLDGDDPSILPLEEAEVEVAGEGGDVRVRSVVLGGSRADGSALGDDMLPGAGLLTSARRIASPGAESTYLDRIASKVLQTVLANQDRLDPFRGEILDDDRTDVERLVTGLVERMQSIGELEAGVDAVALRDRIVRELVDLGPLREIMEDREVLEVQVVGNGAIRVVRDGGLGAPPQMLERRFSGDRALVLAIQRLAKAWGFLAEGAQVLEGRVEAGFHMYALLPPTAVRAPVLSLRRNRTDANSLDALVHEGVMSAEMREAIVAAVVGCRRILICASGGTNLERFMGAIVGEIPEAMRVVCISDSGRLGAGRLGWAQVRRIADPADRIGLSDALGVLLRGGVDMLVSQRCRHEDAAAVIDAMAGATRGAIVSMWGIDSAHALYRLAGLSTVAAGAIQNLTVSLARSVDLLVRLGTGVNGEPMQIVEIVEPRAQEGSEISHVTLFKAERGADGRTAFRATGVVPHFVRDLQLQGVSVPLRVFQT